MDRREGEGKFDNYGWGRKTKRLKKTGKKVKSQTEWASVILPPSASECLAL